MAQPVITVTDTKSGAKKSVWVYASGEMVAAQGAAESIQTARSVKSISVHSDGQFLATRADGSVIARFDLLDSAPAPIAVPSPYRPLDRTGPASAKQVAYLRRLCANPPGGLQSKADYYAARIATITSSEASFAIDELTWQL